MEKPRDERTNGAATSARNHYKAQLWALFEGYLLGPADPNDFDENPRSGYSRERGMSPPGGWS